MKVTLGLGPLMFIFFACSKTSNMPDGVSGRDSTVATSTVPDPIPASISILYGDWLYGTRGYGMPGDLAVVVKNKEGILLNGIPVSFSAGVDCGFASLSAAVTNPAGYVEFSWSLGTSPDSIQTLKVQLQKDTNISVTFHAVAQDIKKYHFVGTLRIVDTTNVGPPYLGPPDFPALSNNTDMPFIIDSFPHIISTLNFPMALSINGHALTGTAYGNSGKTQGGNFVLSGNANESKTYPNASNGDIYSYNETWSFSGSLVNKVYSGTFSLNISIATRGPNEEIYQYAVTKYGTFTTTIQ
jgi:hypothetical protein